MTTWLGTFVRTALPKTTWKDLFQFCMCSCQQFVNNSIHGASVGSLSYKSQQRDNRLKKTTAEPACGAASTNIECQPWWGPRNNTDGWLAHVEPQHPGNMHVWQRAWQLRALWPWGAQQEGFSQHQVGSLDLPDNRTVSRHGGNRRRSWPPQRRWDDAAPGQHHHSIVPNACNSWAALYHLSGQHPITTTPEKRILVSWEPNTHKLMTYTAASSTANQQEGSHAESSRRAQQMLFMESRRSNVLGVQAFQRLVEGTTESTAEEYFNEINIWRTEQVKANMVDGPGDAGQQDLAATTWDRPIDKCRGVKLQHPWVTIQKQQGKVMSAKWGSTREGKGVGKCQHLQLTTDVKLTVKL